MPGKFIKNSSSNTVQNEALCMIKTREPWSIRRNDGSVAESDTAGTYR